jgi:hypothetical protein
LAFRGDPSVYTNSNGGATTNCIPNVFTAVVKRDRTCVVHANGGTIESAHSSGMR